MSNKKTVVTKPDEALWVVGQYNYSKGVAFDTETRDVEFPNRWAHGGSYEEGDPTGISLYNGEEGVYIDTCGWTDEEAQDLYDLLGHYLSSKAELIIAHNIVFDLGVLHKYGVNVEHVEWYDTMTAAHLIDEERKYKGGLGLKALAEVDLGVSVTKDWEDTRHDMEEFHEYGLNDAIWTWELAQKYSDELILQDLDKLFREIEMPFHRVLLQMDVGGVGVDYAKASEIADRSQRVLLEHEVEMYELMGVNCMLTKSDGGEWYIEFEDQEQEINFNSGQQVAQAMLDLGIELTEQTPTGNWSTSKAVLEEINHPFVDILLKHKNLRHICSHFINKLTTLVDSDGRMRPNWKNTGTVTGRLSASRPNFQNLPKAYLDPVGVRECIVAPEGKTLVAIDFSAQETRVMAELSRDPALIRMILEDQDPHLLNANAVFQLGIDEEKMVKTHPEYKAIKEQYDEERNNGKVFSFAVPYGAGSKHISETLGISLQEAEQLMDNLREEFPLLFEAIDKAQKDAQTQGYITSFTGRRRRYPKNRWGRVQGNLNAAFNFLIQGFSADMIRLASIDLYRHIKAHPEYGAQITMMVHDETVVEVKEEYAEQFAQEAVDIFSKCYTFESIPIEADAGIGRTYQDAK